uniref:Uncharacterized protein n=1 Tax=Rhipicephalus zambeziensis TaxID=60191 RepID=A0A224YD20_9ACAR
MVTWHTVSNTVLFFFLSDKSSANMDEPKERALTLSFSRQQCDIVSQQMRNYSDILQCCERHSPKCLVLPNSASCTNQLAPVWARGSIGQDRVCEDTVNRGAEECFHDACARVYVVCVTPIDEE